jgi:protease-4
MKLFRDASEPLQEFTLSGKESEKIVLIPVTGTIDNQPSQSWISRTPGTVQETVAHLKKARADSDVKALLIEIDSPGGSVTASDILHREITAFRRLRPDVKVVAVMMDTAASGGYYIAAACDAIVAHPTTVTGSIGVIFMRADISGLLDMIGARAVVNKSGEFKDMGSPFREPTAEETQVFQQMIDEYYERFVTVVAEGRGMSRDKVKSMADGRIYTGEQALELGLVDQVGYIGDAVKEARSQAKLSQDARVVVYRRTLFHDDNEYNTATVQGGEKPLMDLGLDGYLPELKTGFYYLWMPQR